MSEHKQGVLAIYEYLDHVCNAIKDIRSKPEYADYEVYSPTSYHEIEHACGFGFSPVRWFTLVCGLIGTMSGFGLCILLDLDWPMIVGGKTPAFYSLPAYVVIGFELTILLGGIGTIAGMLIFCKIPNPKDTVLDVRLTDNKFGIFIPGASADGDEAKLLKSFGAEEIKEVGA